MEDSINIEGRRLISASRAAKLTKYSGDYIGQLCRSKKVNGRVIGRSWYVDIESLLEYRKIAEQLSRARGDKEMGKAHSIVPTPEKIVSPLEYYRDEGPLLPIVAKAIDSTESLTVLKTEQKSPLPFVNGKVVASHYFNFKQIRVAAAIVLVLIGLASFRMGIGGAGSKVASELASIEAKIAGLAINPFVALRDSISSVTDLNLAPSNNPRMNSVSTASVWDSFTSAWSSIVRLARGGARRFLGIRDSVPVVPSADPVTVLAVKTESSGGSQIATSTMIVERTVEKTIVEPRTTIVEQLDPTLLARIEAVERSIIKTNVHGQLQTDTIYESLGRSINNVASNYSRIAASNIQTLNGSSIDGATITNSSFTGSTGIFSSDVTVQGSLAVFGPASFGGDALINGNLTASGTLALGGALFDGASSSGTNGMILETTGSGVRWVATSTLGFGAASQIGNGTQGQIAYYDATGSMLTATSSLFIGQNGNVGIGTSTPSYLLDIDGSVQATTYYSVNSLYDTSINGSGFASFMHGNPAQNRVTLGVSSSKGYLSLGNSSNVVTTRLDSNGVSYLNGGNVGIGTTSPYAKLSVVGPVVAEYFTATSTTATSTFAGGMNVGGTAGLTVLQNGNVGIGMIPLSTLGTTPLQVNGNIYTSGGKFMFGGSNYIVSPTTNQIAVVTSALERMRIDSAGNVGIGTTSPFARLSVAGDTYIAGNFTATGTATIGNLSGVIWGTNGVLSAVSTSSLGFMDSSTIGTGTLGQMPYYTGVDNTLAATSSLFIGQNGNVGIGTTSPQAKLDVQGNAYFGNLTGDGSGVRQMRLYSPNATNNSYGYLESGTDGDGNYLKIKHSNGNVKFESTRTYFTSLGGGYSTPFSFSATAASTYTGSTYFINAAPTWSPTSGTPTFNGINLSSTLTPSGLTGANWYGINVNMIENPHLAGLSGTKRLINLQTTNVPKFYVESNGDTYIAGNVGIGTTSPYAKLSIQATAGGTTPLLTIASSTNGLGTSTAFTILADGNIGIGTTSVTTGRNMEIRSQSPMIRLTDSSNSTYQTGYNFGGFDVYSEDDSPFAATPVGSITMLQGGNASYPYADMVFKTGLDGGAAFAERFRVKSTGGVVLSSATELKHLSVSRTNNMPSSATYYEIYSSLVPSSANAGMVGYGLYSKAALPSNSTGNTSYGVYGEGSGSGLNYGGYFSAFGGSLGNYGLIVDQGNVGLGTTSPFAKLSIHDNSGLSGSNPIFVIASSTSGNLSTTTLFKVLGNGDVNINGSTLSGSATNLTINPVNATIIQKNGVTQFTIGGGSGNYTNVDFYSNGANKLGLSTSRWGTIYGTNLDISGNVGVGTTTPNAKLSISASNASVYTMLNLENTNSTDDVIGSAINFSGYNGKGLAKISAFNNPAHTAVSKLQLQTYGTDGVTLNTGLVMDVNGNVGIGTAVPAYGLDVWSSNGVRINTSSNPIYLGCCSTDSSLSYRAWNTKYNGPMSITNADTNGGAYINFQTGLTEKMRIDYAGNVGIGTTSPYFPLSVVGAGGVVAESYTATSTTLFYQNSIPFMISSTTLAGNLAIGYQSASSLDANGGLYSTFIGYQAGNTATSSSYNTGIGYKTLSRLVDNGTLFNNDGSGNTGVGYLAGQNITSGVGNSGFGYLALQGASAGITGSYNTSFNSTMGSLTSGGYNTGISSSALDSVSTGSNNVAIGALTLRKLTTSSGNVAIGTAAGTGLFTGTFPWASVTDSNMTFIGYNATRDNTGAVYSNSIAIGANAIVGGSNMVVIGGTGASAVNLGIGTTSPYAKLSIQSVGGTNPLFVIASSTNGTGTTTALSVLSNGDIYMSNFVGVGVVNSHAAGNLQVAGSGYFSSYFQAATGMYVGNSTSNGAGFKASNNGLKLVDYDGNDSTSTNMILPGNLGIGTTSPYAKLSVVGDIVADYINATSTTATSTFAGGMNVAGTTGLTVLQNGNVGIGFAAPTVKLTVSSGNSGAGYTSGLLITRSNGFTSEGLSLWHDTAGFTNDYIDSRYSGDAAALNFRMKTSGTPVNAMTILGTGNIGIGTTTPNDLLHLVKTNFAGAGIKMSGINPGIVMQSGTSGNIAQITSYTSDNSLRFYTGNTLNALGLVQDVNGNVGIGTTTPANKLDVYGDVSLGNGTSATLKYDSTVVSNGSTMIIQPTYSGTSMLSLRPATGSTQPPAIRLSDSSTDAMNAHAFSFGTGNASLPANAWNFYSTITGNANSDSWPINFGVSNVASGRFTAMTVLNSGNVGIGTVSPSSLFHVNSATAIGTYSRFTNSNTGTTASDGSVFGIEPGGLTTFWNYENQDMFFGTNNAEVMRIKNTGNVGIGTTSPLAKLSVKGGGTSTGINFQTTDSANVPLFSILDNGRVGIGTTSTTYPLVITSSGSVGIGLVSALSETSYMTFDRAGNYNLSTGAQGHGINFKSGRVGTGNVFANYFFRNDSDNVGIAFVGPTYANSGTMGTLANMNLLVGGNVGIGTSSPTNKLEVAGDGYFSGGLGIGASNATAGTIKTSGAINAGAQITTGSLYMGGGGGNELKTYFNTVVRISNEGVAAGNDAVYLQASYNVPQLRVTTNGIKIDNALAVGSTTLPTNGVAWFNGNVGIGTTSPAYNLDVYGNTGIKGNLTFYGTNSHTLGSDGYSFININSVGTFAFNNGTSIKQNSPNNYDMSFFTGSPAVSNMTISSAGNIGIGTTSPFAKLSVAGDTYIGGDLTATGTATIGNLSGVIWGTNGVLSAVSTSTLGLMSSTTIGMGTSGQMPYYTGVGNTLAATSSLFIGQNGNVGVGTASPSAQLSILRDSSYTNPADQFSVIGSAYKTGSLLWSGNATTTLNSFDTDNRFVYGLKTFVTENIINGGGPGAYGVYSVASTTGNIGGLAVGGYFSAVSTNGGGAYALITDKGNVGIGTSTPAYPLDIYSASPVYSQTGYLSKSGSYAMTNGTYYGGNFLTYGSGQVQSTFTAQGGIISNNASYFRQNVSNNSYFAGTGNLGIGTTTTPLAKLDVYGSPGQANIFNVSSSTGMSYLTVTSAGNLGVGTTSPFAELSVSSASQDGSLPLLIVASSTNATLFTVLGNGSVGIGTMNPTYNLEVIGGIRATDNVTANNYVRTNSIRPFAAYADLVFKNSTVNEKMRMTDGGNLGIGTSTPFSRLTVAGDTWLDSNIIRIGSSTSAGVVMAFQTSATTTIPDNTAYAWTIATSTTAEPLFKIDTLGGYATTTIGGSGSGDVQIGDANSPTNLLFGASASILAGGNTITFGGAGDKFNFAVNLGIASATPRSALTVGAGDIGAYNGAICADNGGLVKCYAALTAGVVYGDSSSFTASDLAENYSTAEAGLEAGDIVSVADSLSDEEKNKRLRDKFALSSLYSGNIPESILNALDIPVTKADSATSSVIGIVSTKPGVLLGDVTGTDLETTVKPIALSGRVPVKVNNEGGAIKTGDRIALSSVAGVGRKAKSTEAGVGIALENFNGVTGKINVFVNLAKADSSAETVATLSSQVNSLVSNISANASTTSSIINIVANGNVGFGTTTPGAKLAVQGGGYFGENLFVGGAITSTSTATSTFAGNLDVTGTIRGGFVYAGDLFFANKWSFTEAPLNGETQGIMLRNQNGRDALSIDENGNLSLIGDVCFDGKQCFGKSINSLSNTINNLASSTALSILSATATTTASLSEMFRSLENANLALVGLSARFDRLASTTLDIEALATTTAEALSKSDSFIEKIWNSILARFSSVGVTISQAFTRINNLFVDTIRIENRLCVDDVCIGKEQLKALLIQAGGTYTSSTTAATSTFIATPSPTPSSSPESAPVIAPSPSPSLSPAATSTPTVAPEATTTPVVTLEASTTPVVSPNPTPSATSTPAIEATPTPSPTPSPAIDTGSVPTPSPSPEATISPAVTVEPTPTPSASPTPIVEPTPIPTPEASSTPVPDAP